MDKEFTHFTNMGPPRNPGVLFDSTCFPNDHGNKICQNVKKSIPSKKFESILTNQRLQKNIYSTVTSRLDIAKAFYVASMESLVSQLQR